MKIQHYKNKQAFLYIILFVFTIIYSSISIVNHYYFRTAALDLGVYNHALYHFAHFKNAVFTLGIDGKEMAFLGTHFSPIMFFYVPFYYLFGSYTLLIVQVLAILIGGIGIYKYSTEKFPNISILPKLILIQFFSIWGIYSALAFDFHNNVIASMLVIWFIYFIEKKNYKLSIVFWIIVIICQENMAIWMIFVLIGLIIKHRNESRDIIKFNAVLIIFTVIYAVIVIKVIMPAYQGSENNLQIARYSHLGLTFKEIMLTIIQRPIYILGLLFKNILEDPIYNGIKTELHFMILVSGGICLFLRPAYLIMLVPIYAQKLLSNDYSFWGINYQYSIEFVPIISLAFIDLLNKAKRYQKHIAIIIVISTIVFNINSINHRKSKWYNKTNTMFYGKRHYDPKIDTEEIKSALKAIEKGASVSASSVLVPHLTSRDKLYLFPINKDSDYIALIKNNRPTYPISKEKFEELLTKYQESLLYETIFNGNDIIVLKKSK